jgi:hypothetical protein
MPSQLNPPRVPCVQETSRRPDLEDETTGAHFTPTGQPITVVDSVCSVGFVGPFNPPILGAGIIIGPDQCEVGKAAQYRVAFTGNNVTDEEYLWTLSDTQAEITPPGNTPVIEVQFNVPGVITLQAIITSATAGDSPLIVEKDITIVNP